MPTQSDRAGIWSEGTISDRPEGPDFRSQFPIQAGISQAFGLVMQRHHFLQSIGILYYLRSPLNKGPMGRIMLTQSDRAGMWSNCTVSGRPEGPDFRSQFPIQAVISQAFGLGMQRHDFLQSIGILYFLLIKAQRLYQPSPIGLGCGQIARYPVGLKGRISNLNCQSELL